MNGIFFLLSVAPKIFSFLGGFSKLLHDNGYDRQLVDMEEAFNKLKTANSSEEKHDALTEITEKTRQFFN